jgi:aspartyl-tRNA(Asn)/glutamyl-tRNA(Gln) amidotransferase subunit A
MAISPTRQSFRDSLALLQSLGNIDPGCPPAFLQPLDLLERWPRPLLPDAPIARLASQTAFPSISTSLARIAQHDLTVVGLVEAALQAIQTGEQLNAFVYVAPAEQLLAEARQLDARLASGTPPLPLHGMPISVKDVIAVAGMPNTASSLVLANNYAKVDASSVRRLREAGAIIIGKAQTHEFALGVTTPQSRHPLDITRNPGGSSGGSAISVVTGMSVASLGTDTRASIRVPSALCGAVGYKPTFGLIPTDGVTTLSWSLDHIAPMAQTVRDTALLLDVLIPGGNYATALSKDVRGLRIGIPVSALDGAEPEVLNAFEQAVAAIESLGCQVVRVEHPSKEDFDLAVALGLILSRSEASNYHRAFGDLHANAERYTRPVYEQLDEAAQVSAADYLQAQRWRTIIRQRVLAQLQRFDAMLMPTCLVTAPKSTDVERYFLVLSQNCILWSFIGVPAISVPCGYTSAGLPVGAQLVAGPFEDARLLAIAAALEGQFASAG